MTNYATFLLVTEGLVGLSHLTLGSSIKEPRLGEKIFLANTSRIMHRLEKSRSLNKIVC